ncbi:cysteine proteinase [Klebsormidium nitens]|uniref:Cysteine proteinase n=1 Tax=Klebsormidium nitens TaxID=105231 RepID=A0A1Y1HXN9_KLENI|nr:cysteine proteinase [Klebsormidium nitens]|eukprot:GAQ83405.1 cysteine proteinase [Klebsormidium nitens]
MARLPLKFLTAALLLQLFLAVLAMGSSQGIPNTAHATPLQERSDSAVTQRQLLQALPSSSFLPNITIPPFLLNITAAQAYNLSSVNRTLILSQLRVSPNLTELFGENVTRDYVETLVDQTLPLVLACASNATGDLFVCFRTWQAVFNKSSLNATEEQFRFAVFVNNTRAIVAQNAALVSFFTLPNRVVNQTQIAQLFLEMELPLEVVRLLNSTQLVGLHEYIDRTRAELRGRYQGALPDEPPLGGNVTLTDEPIGALPNEPPLGENVTAIGTRRLLQSTGAPRSSNWIEYANPIKDQGLCGFCWVFSATASLEIMNNMIVKRVVYNRSEEAIVDCLGIKCDPGGGKVEWSSWVPKNRFWPSAWRVPYQQGNGDTTQCPAGTPEFWFKSLVKCPYNWANWKKILDVQPTLLYFNTEQLNDEYKGPKIYDKSCVFATQTNHIVLAYGYNSMTERNGDVVEYLLFRNSWGKSFGFGGNGAFAMTRNGKDLHLCASTRAGIVFHTNPKIPGLPNLVCDYVTLTNVIN